MKDTPFTEARLLSLYDRVTEADDAIPRLRRFVLDLAVRGKLVPQEAGDEPASMLLEAIKREKTRLVDAGEIRKPRELDDNSGWHEPFIIPRTWAWVRLDGVGAIIGGGTPSATDHANFAEPGEGIPWLTPADLGGNRSYRISRGTRDLTDIGLSSSSATLMPAGTVLFTSRAPIGYVAIAANPLSTNQGFKSIVPYVSGCSDFIAVAMRAFAPAIDAAAPGTTFKEVSGKIVAGLPFPLPPLAEQHRIVAKVEKLMALLDRLDAARAAREETRTRLTAATLSRLTEADTDTPAAARFALRTLPALTTRPDQIKTLRQTILNLAVRGKLVEQDPADGTANAVLTRIEQERGKVRRGTVRFEPEHGAFPVPSSWTWTTLGQLIVFGPQNGISPHSTNRQDAPRAITLTATTSGTFNSSHFKHVEVQIPEDSDFWLSDGDLLFQRGNTREYVGMAAIYRGPAKTFLYPDLIMKVRISEQVCLKYVHLSSVSPPSRYFLSANASGAQATMPKINQSTLVSLPIPLPPLAEQHRIVAKVEELMSLCDRLERALQDATTTRARLLDATLREALASAQEAA